MTAAQATPAPVAAEPIRGPRVLEGDDSRAVLLRFWRELVEASAISPPEAHKICGERAEAWQVIADNFARYETKFLFEVERIRGLPHWRGPTWHALKPIITRLDGGRWRDPDDLLRDRGHL